MRSWPASSRREWDRRCRPPRRTRRSVDMLGKLTWQAITFVRPIPLIAGSCGVAALLAILGWITLKGHTPCLWRECITSADHKRIGIMYVVLARVMLLR